MVDVLFVCLGNICRSPMAEAIFQRMVDEAQLSAEIAVDSAGIGSWHVAESAHPGTRQVLKEHGIDYLGRARQIRHGDMSDPKQYIIVMDESNLNDLYRRFGPHPRMARLLEFADSPGSRDVPDPYYSGDFQGVYQLVHDGCLGLLAYIRRREGL